MNYSIYIEGLIAILILSILTWLLSIFKRDVSIVDSIWSLMILTGGIVYIFSADTFQMRTTLILALLLIWSLRLSAYLTWRNWGEDEDRRYQEIRANYSPNFALKSLGIIFLLQAVLAWIISLPLWPALTASIELQPLDFIGIALWLFGMSFETIGDWQLARFKSDPHNKGNVMDKGLWRYTRHPNYFGEAIIWWGFYLFAVSAGAWWAFPAPLLITWLLLKFSGVVMLEETIVERRPAYRKYIATTNAFIPGLPKQSGQVVNGGQIS